MEIKFYKCEICGQIIAIVKATGSHPVCCGKEMKELIPGDADASNEKHIPVIETEGNKVLVRIGSMPHPMTKEHCIEWIVLETKCGNQRKVLKCDMKPEACFRICEGDDVIAAYAYCNLHGLWKAEFRMT